MPPRPPKQVAAQRSREGAGDAPAEAAAVHAQAKPRHIAGRRHRERYARAPWMQRYEAGRPEWRPRVGDVVPAGVPLYPVPPGYGPRPPYRAAGGFGPGWDGPRPYGGPPFPGERRGFFRDDDE